MRLTQFHLLITLCHQAASCRSAGVTLAGLFCPLASLNAPMKCTRWNRPATKSSPIHCNNPCVASACFSDTVSGGGSDSKCSSNLSALRFFSAGMLAVMAVRSWSTPITVHLLEKLPSAKILVKLTSIFRTSTSAAKAERMARPTPLMPTPGVSSMNKFVMNRTGMSISLPSARSSCTMAYQSISFCHLESAPGVLSKFLSFTGHSRSVSKCKSHTTRPEMREATLAAALSPKAMLLSCTRWGPSSSSHQICR